MGSYYGSQGPHSSDIQAGEVLPLLIMISSLKVDSNGTLGCLFLVGLFSVMWVRTGYMALADLTGENRLYGFTCGQVMYYLTHYYMPGDHAYVTSLVRHDYYTILHEQ